MFNLKFKRNVSTRKLTCNDISQFNLTLTV